ncbi:MAG TPA: hypothetical protein VGV69_08390 [Solirubrobacterales bacterium]|nr:hypothetical protein [Solirubrobacterales bacterium]
MSTAYDQDFLTDYKVKALIGMSARTPLAQMTVTDLTDASLPRSVRKRVARRRRRWRPRRRRRHGRPRGR